MENNEIKNDALFVNNVSYTKANLLEKQRGAYPLWIKICLLLVAGFYTVSGILVMVFYYDFTGGIIQLALSVAIYFVVFTLPPIIVNRQYRRFLELYRSDPQVKTYFGQEGILQETFQTEGKLNIDYLRIIKITQTRNFYLLWLRGKLYVSVAKAGFEKGDGREFINFILTKATNAKIKL
ncbi:MAG: hypothetical protein GX061_01900 [Eubacteriaceae bacterium]|nr:hypothetical protein [Eubacteriaceae bacterium]